MYASSKYLWREVNTLSIAIYIHRPHLHVLFYFISILVSDKEIPRCGNPGVCIFIFSLCFLSWWMQRFSCLVDPSDTLTPWHSDILTEHPGTLADTPTPHRCGSVIAKIPPRDDPDNPSSFLHDVRLDSLIRYFLVYKYNFAHKKNAGLPGL